MADSPAPTATSEQFRLELQQAVIDVLSTARTAASAGSALLPALGSALRWDFTALWVVRGGEIECVEAWSVAEADLEPFREATKGRRFRHGDGLPGRVWRDGSAVWLAELPQQQNFPRLTAAREAGLRSGLALPIRNVSGVVAVIECFSRTPRPLQPDSLQVADYIGKQIGQFLQRLAAEEQVQENQRRYAAIINGALDAIVAIDPDGRITEFNAAAERLFGYTRAEALGRDMAALIIPEGFRAAHREGLARLRAAGEARILERRLELAAIRRDGSEFPVELTISRFAGEGQGGFIGFLRDITERQRYSQEREALLAREQRALQEASTASRLKDEFLAALSHELRTPLNAILGWAQMLERGTLAGDKVDQAIGAIRRNAEAQHQVVNDMLDLSAFIAGRVKLTVEAVALREPIEEALETIRPAAAGKRLIVRLSLPDVTVMGDKTRLQQVFWNLLGNAVKFTPDGGRIEVRGTLRDSAIAVEVHDTGAGMDPAFVPFVFDRFRQATPTRGQGGLGLGLAIVKQIVEAHGGRVSAHSEGEGSGSRFTVELPVARRD